MDVIWGLGARYCLRQDAHAFMWLWGLFLALGGAAFIVRRRGRAFEAAVLLLFSICTGAFGLTIFYACYNSAPYQLGLGSPDVAAGRLTTLNCLSNGAATWVFLWTVVVLLCCGAVGLVALGRSRDKAVVLRIFAYVAAAVCLLLVGFAGFVWLFDFSWCASQRLF